MTRRRPKITKDYPKLSIPTMDDWRESGASVAGKDHLKITLLVKTPLEQYMGVGWSGLGANAGTHLFTWVERASVMPTDNGRNMISHLRVWTFGHQLQHVNNHLSNRISMYVSLILPPFKCSDKENCRLSQPMINNQVSTLDCHLLYTVFILEIVPSQI